MIFSESTIRVWAYNIETVLAEKVETVLQRGELNTRPRDFYDIYILTNTQDFDKIIFTKALRTTAVHRNTVHIFKNIQNRISIIQSSEILRTRWISYTRNYHYAEGISYEDTINALNSLLSGTK